MKMREEEEEIDLSELVRIYECVSVEGGMKCVCVGKETERNVCRDIFYFFFIFLFLQ